MCPLKYLKGMTMHRITLMKTELIESYRQAVGSVAREKKFLAFLDTPSLAMAREFVQNNINENSPHVIALIGEKVIGWCDIVSINRPVAKHVGCLGIGVIDGYREAGIGKALMSEALRLAKLKGLERIELTVREDNIRAIAMYKKFGFATEGVHQKSVLIDGNYYNQLFMALLF